MNIDKAEKIFMSICVFICITSVIVIYANIIHSKSHQKDDLLKYHLDDKELDRCYHYAMKENKSF